MYAEQSPFLEKENSCQHKVFVFMNYSSDMTRIAEMVKGWSAKGCFVKAAKIWESLIQICI